LNKQIKEKIAFDFQKFIIEKSIEKGRIGIFADTGLGKTLIQLSIAKNIIQHTNKKVLILTPLAVAFQFILEAEKLGIDDVEYSKDGTHTKKIVICNYERLHYFNENDFVGVICDESSILKNFDGKIKNQITSFIKKIPYRFLSTATPSPNDFIELGTSSEALGYMGYMDMLTKFFKNNQNSVDSNNRNIGEKFYLKPHAEKDFFAWVNQWAIMIKMPSDLGFSNDKYNLPELILNKHIVANQSLIDRNGQFQLFTPIAKSMTEVRHEQKQTEIKRCEKAIELAHNKTSVYWCNTNNESSILKSSDKNAVEIIGSQSIDKKEEILLAFANGEIKRLITKAKMTSMGLNWQHCNHSVFFPTWSYEQYYQAIRRFWRFGQKNNVIIDMVISDGQTRVIEALEQKTQKAIELHKNLTENVNKVFNNKTKQFNQTIIKPKFI
jgi:ERCC4-related helicase